MFMYAPDALTQAEDRHAERMERKETARDKAKADLAGEYMACATMPLLSSVWAPTDLNQRRRLPFVDVFFDGLTWSKNTHLQSRAIATLLRHAPEIVQELASQHAEDYADEVEQ